MRGEHFVCQCVICHDYGDRDEADRMDVKIVEDVKRSGWHVVAVPEDEVGPGFAYTIGLAHSFGAPDLAMFGLSTRVMGASLNTLGQQAADGSTLADGQENTEVIKNYPVILRLADLRWYRTFFGRAIRFYRRPPFPVLQVCWPNVDSVFHWQDNAGEQHRESQPQLWLRPSEHPRGVWTVQLE